MNAIFYILGIITILTNLYIVISGGKPELELMTYTNMSYNKQAALEDKIMILYILILIKIIWLIYGYMYAPNSLYFIYYIIICFITLMCNIFYRMLGFNINKIYYIVKSIIAIICEVLLMYNCLN